MTDTPGVRVELLIDTDGDVWLVLEHPCGCCSTRAMMDRHMAEELAEQLLFAARCGTDIKDRPGIPFTAKEGHA